MNLRPIGRVESPIGIHPVEILEIVGDEHGDRFRVRDLEALDATPVLDIKPVLKAGG